MFRALQKETIRLSYSLSPGSPSCQWVVGLNDYVGFFQVLLPAPSQKPLLMGRTSPKAVHTFSENRAGYRRPHLRAGREQPGPEPFRSCLASTQHDGKSPLAWSQRSSHFFSLESLFPQSENWNLTNRATQQVNDIGIIEQNVLTNRGAPYQERLIIFN